MYKVPDTVRSTHTRDGAVVLDIRHGEVFNLNPVGSRILELIKNGSTEMAVTDDISRQFGIDRSVVQHDVQDFVAVLRRQQLIVDTGSNGKDSSDLVED